MKGTKREGNRSASDFSWITLLKNLSIFKQEILLSQSNMGFSIQLRYCRESPRVLTIDSDLTSNLLYNVRNATTLPRD